jgi:MSHA biogenesis protein MshM
MQPLSRNMLESYLMFRMRAAGYHGPNIFSPPALKLIADTSSGLMRRVNILADKSLLAAFVEDTHNIEARHVQAAMRDSELRPTRSLPGKKSLIAATAALVVIGASAWWMLAQDSEESILLTSPLIAEHVLQPPATTLLQDALPTPTSGISSAETIIAPPAPATDTPNSVVKSSQVASIISPMKQETGNVTMPSSMNQKSEPASANRPTVSAPNGSPVTATFKLFEQRFAAGKQLLEQAAATGTGQEKPVASIQLFYKEQYQQGNIEGFLKRADKLGALPEIYLVSTKPDGQGGLRILYGAYPSIAAARSAITTLPARYQEAFAPSIYIFQ